MGEDGPWAAGEVWAQGELRVWFVLQGGAKVTVLVCRPFLHGIENRMAVLAKA